MLRALYCCLLVLMVAASFPLHAQGEDIMNWRATVQKTEPAPVQAPTPYRARKRYDQGGIAPGPPLSSLPDNKDTSPAVQHAESRAKILILGDSLAEALAFGFAHDETGERDLTFNQRIVSASGLVRDDFYDWPKQSPAFFADHRDAAALIIMLGLNDRQALRENGVVLEPLGEAWCEAYRRRIDALLNVAAAAKLPVLWVGMPVMRSETLAADLRVINSLIQERVALAGQGFIDTFDAFADANGAFAASGPDIMGDNLRLRGQDGIHFTPAGQRKLAFFVEKALHRLIKERPAASPDAPPAPEQPPVMRKPASPGEPAPALASLPPVNASPLPTIEDFAILIPPPDSTLAPALRARPAMGDTAKLGERKTAPKLVGRESPALRDDITRALFDRGLAPPPRPGRSDDFTWKPDLGHADF